MIETAFRDDDIELATISRHLCPAQLQRELERLPGPTDVCITHIKPGEVGAVMSEIGAQATRHRITALVSGQVMRCDCTPTRRGHASNVRAKLHAAACQLERG